MIIVKIYIYTEVTIMCTDVYVEKLYCCVSTYEHLFHIQSGLIKVWIVCM